MREKIWFYYNDLINVKKILFLIHGDWVLPKRLNTRNKYQQRDIIIFSVKHTSNMIYF